MGFASFLKCWIYASVALVIVVGIIIEIIFLVLAFAHFAEATDSKGKLIAIGTVFFVILLIIGLLGCYGVKNHSFILLILYTVIIGLIFVGLWISFGYMKKGKSNIHDDYDKLCNGETKDFFLNDLKEVYDNNLDTVMCTAACPCKADKTKFPATYAAAVMNANTGASTIANCPNDPTKDIKDSILSFLGWGEEELECSGICKQERYYYFSNVAAGVPPESCKTPILDYVDSSSL